ncbi:MAG TPA: M91 family zinc metallopeptidase [Blastocatellia bacterium]|nr:M91 family zinc metallopeptidase [Blastocatellia bacterium]
MAVDTPTRWDGIIIRLRSASESAMFPGLVAEALNTIYSKPVGKKLLDQIAAQGAKKKFGYTICIMRPANLSLEDKNDGKGPQWSGGSIAKRENEVNASNGTGSVTALTWNPNSMSTPGGPRPPFIGLAHELIHALYSLKGEGYTATMEEELRTVGLEPYVDAREITENKIRAEHNIPLRTSY